MTKNLFFLSLLFASFSAYSQKDAPITGNAACLVDLLKKNYNTLDPDTKNEELFRDRALVVSIFKSYLSDSQRQKLSQLSASNTSYNALAKDLSKTTTTLNARKKVLNLYNNITSLPTISGVVQETVIENAAKNVDISSKESFLTRNKMDSLELLMVDTIYQSSNKFVSTVIKSFLNKYNYVVNGFPDALAGVNYSSSLQKSIPFIGGNMGFETYVDGLARFLAKRIKDELTTYSIENIKKWLENPSANDPLAEFKIILPRTTSFIKNFNSDKLTSFPNEIRQYIEDDLNHILTNSMKLKITPRTARLIQQYPNLEFAFDALKIIPALSNIKYPIDYFKLLETSETLKKWKNGNENWQFNLVSSIEMANMLAYSMIVIENDEPKFAGTNFLAAYNNDVTFYKLYIGFLYQQNEKYHKISFKNKKNDDGKLSTALEQMISSNNTSKIEQYQNIVESTLSNIAGKGEKVYTTALEIKQAKKTGKKIGADTIFTFVNSIIDLSDQVISSGSILAKNLLYDSKFDTTSLSSLNDTRAYLSMARSGNDIVFDLQKKQYATALTKSLQMAGELVPETNLSDITSLLANIYGIYRPDGNINNWHLVVINLKKNVTSNEFRSKLDETAGKLAREMSNIKYFYTANYKGVTADALYSANIDKIDELRSLFLEIEAPSNKNIDMLRTKAESHVNDDEFKIILVSYYTNTAIKLMATKIVNTICDYKINGSLIFDKNDVTDLDSSITRYSKATYDNYILNGNRGEKDPQLILESKKLNQVITNVLTKLPQRTDVTVNPKVISMINFVNGMATAKDAGEVEKTIEAFALPTGSYSIKRKSQFNLSLNSYPGVLPALEITWKDKIAYGAFSFGFTAPVGLSLTWGNSNESSIGLFIPVIDVGALTRFRLDGSSTTKALPELKFSNIFSPGLYFHYDFKKSPFTILVGGQYGPDLQEVTSDANNINISKNFESVRLGIGLVLDIPLLNIHTKSKL